MLRSGWRGRKPRRRRSWSFGSCGCGCLKNSMTTPPPSASLTAPPPPLQCPPAAAGLAVARPLLDKCERAWGPQPREGILRPAASRGTAAAAASPRREGSRRAALAAADGAGPPHRAAYHRMRMQRVLPRGSPPRSPPPGRAAPVPPSPPSALRALLAAAAAVSWGISERPAHPARQCASLYSSRTAAMPLRRRPAAVARCPRRRRTPTAARHSRRSPRLPPLPASGQGCLYMDRSPLPVGASRFPDLWTHFARHLPVGGRGCSGLYLDDPTA
jgi:hypothetical protein